MALLCDMYVGDVTAPGPKAHFESDGMTLEELEDAIEAVSNAAAGAEEDGEAVAVTGISPDQLKEELWWLPYEENGYALSRRYAVEGKMALEGGDKEAAAKRFGEQVKELADPAKRAAAAKEIWDIYDKVKADALNAGLPAMWAEFAANSAKNIAAQYSSYLDIMPKEWYEKNKITFI